MKFADTVFAGFTAVLFVAKSGLFEKWAGDEVGIDLKRDESESVEGVGIDDGHVVCIHNCRTGQIGAGTDANVGYSFVDTFLDGFDETTFLAFEQEAKGITATDKDGLSVFDASDRVFSVLDTNKVASSIEAVLDHLCGAGVVIGNSKGNEYTRGNVT